MRDAVTLYAPTTIATAGGDEPGVALNVTGNTELEPEKSTEYEFGFDAGFLRDRIGVGFTYYNKKSKDALISRRLPGSLGLTTTVFQNLGEIRNKGTELSLDFNVLDLENVGLDVGFTNTTLDNEVLRLGEDVEDITFNRGIQRHTPGKPAGGFWQRKVVYDDADGNGLLSTDEVTLEDDASYLGTALPKWQRTVSADLRLFDWITVSTQFEGRGGHMTANDTEAFRCYLSAAWGSGEAGCFSGWSPDASLYDQARYISYTYNGSMAMWIEPADFWKWRELSVAFDIPSYLTERAPALNGLRVTVAGRNLATWTDYTGLDPETVEGGGTANFSQSEFNTQPPVRYLMIRLDYSF
jgi:outer membrane receptor protein involved in Fe transport